MKIEHVYADVTVVGGGLAGICATISAARKGSQVVLVQNRPVLGGNSSSEIRVWVSGATSVGRNRYARETGIMGELFLENQYRNPEGNPYLWDAVLLDAVRAEPNITLYLNTDVQHVHMKPENDTLLIRSVEGWMMGSERRFTFESQQFIDCSGDGLVGYMAGAEYRLGREGRDEFHEPLAPEVADDITLGSTILFYTKDTGKPVTFIAPDFARDIEQTSIPMNRIIKSGDSGCHYWWIEWGGELDSVDDNERIRDELWSVIYGIWDYIKNSGQFKADNLTLEWVGSVPGKREYRRFVGDYILNQNDIIDQAPFDDRVAFGGWSIDLHPPEGMYSQAGGSKHFHADGIYHIPYRCLYSINVHNLLFAGRNISASHVAFGTTRVMATCAVMGEAVGAAAALSIQHQTTPRGLYEQHLQELQQTLIKQDASMIGISNQDPLDVALRSKIQASSYLSKLAVESAHHTYHLDHDVGLLFPVNKTLQSLELMTSSDGQTDLVIELWDTGKPENYIPYSHLATSCVSIPQGQQMWVQVELNWSPDVPQNAFIIIKENDQVQLHLSDQALTGVLCFTRQTMPAISSRLEERMHNQAVVEWEMKSLHRSSFCFRVTPDTKAYAPEQVINGFSRPYGQPNLWVSGNDTSMMEWLEMILPSPIELGEIHLLFNDDVNEYLNNLHFSQTPFRVMPEIVKQFKIQAWTGYEWADMVMEPNNRKRKYIHYCKQGLSTEKIKIVFYSTNGSARFELIEMRVYSQTLNEGG